MTPEQFVAKWRNTQLKEKSGYVEHFTDLCRLVEHPTPAEADPTGAFFAFEAGATKQSGGRCMTNLYNHWPAWLAAAHRMLDTAFCAAYGWPDDLSDEEILARLLALNLQRAGQTVHRP